MRSPAARGVGVGPPEPEPPRSVNGERFCVAASLVLLLLALLLLLLSLLVVVMPPVAPVGRIRVGEIDDDDDDDDFFEGVPAAAVPLLLRRGVFERGNSGEIVVVVEGARIFAREEAVGEVRRDEVGEEEEVRGRDLRVGGFEFGFEVVVVASIAEGGAGERNDRGTVVGRGVADGLEAEEDDRRPVPMRDAVGETEAGRERVACRGGCEVEGEGKLDFWTVWLEDLREVSGDERREGVAFPDAIGRPAIGLWDDLSLLLRSFSFGGPVARGEMAGAGERGKGGLVVVMVVVGDGLRAAAAGSGDAASPANSISDAEVVGICGKGFSSADDTGSGASAASSPPSSGPPDGLAASVASLAGDDASASSASIVASVGASCMSGNASRADLRFVWSCCEGGASRPALRK